VVFVNPLCPSWLNLRTCLATRGRQVLKFSNPHIPQQINKSTKNKSTTPNQPSDLRSSSDSRDVDLQTFDLQTFDFQTFRPSDLQTFDFQTFRPSDLQTFRPSTFRLSDFQTFRLSTPNPYFKVDIINTKLVAEAKILANAAIVAGSLSLLFCSGFLGTTTVLPGLTRG